MSFFFEQVPDVPKYPQIGIYGRKQIGYICVVFDVWCDAALWQGY